MTRAGKSSYKWLSRAPDWVTQADLEAMERMFFAALAEAGYPGAEEPEFVRTDDIERVYRTFSRDVPDEVSERARVLVFQRFGVPYTEITADGDVIEHEGRQVSNA